jgi:glutamyl-Q tRNA(Asp) synthetase
MAEHASARPGYRGRFAPSPTGPLHFGSLAAAVASYADARAAGGAWLVRIEDIDTPRTVSGAEDSILRALEQFGMGWDEPVVRQSGRTALYRDALEELKRSDAVFPCGCTRREVERVYPGTCREGLPAGKQARAWRLRVSGSVEFEDRRAGLIRQNLETEAGDFVLLRADGIFAYQLAAVVDDASQAITDVVRGADLLDSTPRQIFLQRRLKLPALRYLHVPVAVDEAGEKLSKHTGAPPVDTARPLPELIRAAKFLGYGAPMDRDFSSPADFWRWLIPAWRG